MQFFLLTLSSFIVPIRKGMGYFMPMEKYLLFCLLAFLPALCFSQGDADSTTGGRLQGLSSLSPKYFQQLRKKYEKLERSVSKANSKALSQLKKQEGKLREQMENGGDSMWLLAYENMEQQLQQTGTKKKSALKDYIPGMDSIQSGVKWLKQQALIKLSGDQLKALSGLGDHVNGLQQQLEWGVQVKMFIEERRNDLKRKLQEKGVAKVLRQANKQVYYYQQQIEEYRNMFSNPDKLVEKMIALLRNQPSFKEFMGRNSQLAQMFRIPGNGSQGGVAMLTGLQTRESVQQMLTQQMQSAVGVPGNLDRYLEQQVGQAKGELDKLKDKVNRIGGGNSELEVPDFKPNSQRTKSFLKRLELGVSLQSQRSNDLLPITTDMALMLGYKLNDRSTIGVGVSYKLGWGKGLREIRFSHQGVGVRSFVDIKVKGSVWITGGYELNYLEEFRRIDVLKNLSAWQQSGLIGLSKQYKVGKKKGKFQLLWDMLSYRQMPRGKALQVRLGYTL